jgi:hypothetical protein
MNNIKQTISKSLSFLDNTHINLSIIIILILYCSQLFLNINHSIEILYKYNVVKFLILLVIVFIANKDTNIAILLAISYVISLSNIENFFGPTATKKSKTKKLQAGGNKSAS